MGLKEFMTNKTETSRSGNDFPIEKNRNLRTVKAVTSVIILNSSQTYLISLYQHF